MSSAVMLTSCSTGHRNLGQVRAVENRLADADLQDAMTGALLWLEDNQIRDRPGRHSSFRDSSSVHGDCRPVIRTNGPIFHGLEVPAPPQIPIRSLGGEWASELHFLPGRCTNNSLSLVVVQDSDFWSTANVALSLALFDDSELPPKRRFLTGMLQQALSCAERFRRGDGYGFWIKLPGAEGRDQRIGPLNIPVHFLRASASAWLAEDYSDFRTRCAEAPFGAVSRRFLWCFIRGAPGPSRILPPDEWVAACLDRERNPAGADALFNVPNDADDTAMAVVLHRTFGALSTPGSGVDAAALETLGRHRDLGRAREDARQNWKGMNSGAFLTWLADDSAPTFASPQTGVIPLGINNVDAVVNANVVYALALAGRKDQPGYDQAIALVERVASERTWPEAGLYYPQAMMFPYVVARAYRDGGAQERPMRRAINRLRADLVQASEDFSRAHPSRKGGFPASDDRSEALAIALGLNALLDMGPSSEKDVISEIRYHTAIEFSVKRLLALRQKVRPRDAATRELMQSANGRTVSWPAGVCFASSFSGLAHWRSEAFTTALALEALARYAMGYDLGIRPHGTGDVPRLRVTDAKHAPSGLKLVTGTKGH